MIVTLAKSKAGHDKNQVYVVYRDMEESLLLVNGETKPIQKPKLKKRIHVQPIKNLPGEVVDIAKAIDELDDIAVKKILKTYNRRNENV